jgi:P4 family phage/plasmid primase-like protien
MNQAAEISHSNVSCSSAAQIQTLERKRVADSIPAIIKNLPKWVAWKSVPRLDDKKPTKVPLDVRTERGAQANNPRTWSSFNDVFAFIEEWSGEDHTHIDGSGVEITGTMSEFPGYFFSAEDPFCGIDLDDCRDPESGEVSPWAREIIEHFNSYTELSQSGTGFHILIIGQKPAGSRSRKGGIECYDRDRYFICTGDVVDGHDTINDRQAELESFLDKYLVSKPKAAPSNRKRFTHVDDQKIQGLAQTVLDRALRSQKCLKIKALLEGKTAGLPSDSEGDISLCNYLVFFCGNMVEEDVYRIVDEIFRNSKRMRPKWDKIHRPADGATYGQMTIEQAIKGTQDRYQTIDKLDVAAQDEETPLWSFEDAEIHIEKQKGRSLSNSQKIVLSQDVLEHSDFGPIEEALIKDLLKKVTGINKTAMDRFKKDRLGNGKATADSLTHSELSAHFIAAELPEDPTKSTACEGKIWVYNDDSGIFEAMPLTEVEIKVGDNYQTKYCKRGSDYKSIAILVHNRVLDEDFFKNAPRGLPGETAFFCVDNTGSISRKEYEPTLRQRFKLGCDPDSNCVTPIFSTFMNDSFPKNQNQQDLIQEIFGAMLTGLSSKLQTAFFLYGAGANGKSVLLEILDGLVSRELKCSVKPDMFGNEYYRAELAGKLINIVGEVDKDKQITADFKDVVGCDVPVTARMPYERPFRFTPLCGHFFAGNGFPQTRDHSMGFYRRWRFVQFKNIVPEGKRIPALAKKILATETPGILFWALDGAKRLIKNDYKLTTTTEHKDLIAQWQLSGDSVEAFLNDDTYVQIHPSVSCEKGHAFEAYRHYCSFAGVRYIGLHKFYQRIGTRFREHKKPHEKRTFEGFDVLYSR